MMCRPTCWRPSHSRAASSPSRSMCRAYPWLGSEADRIPDNSGRTAMLNVCLVGHGMMGVWHSNALQRVPDCRLHTVVGRARKPDAAAPAVPTAGRRGLSTEEFAAKYGYQKWTTNLDEALNDPEVDIVIIAGPSDTHADMALASLEHGKHTLVEIPIAMNLEGSERVVTTAKERGLTLG